LENESLFSRVRWEELSKEKAKLEAKLGAKKIEAAAVLIMALYRRVKPKSGGKADQVLAFPGDKWHKHIESMLAVIKKAGRKGGRETWRGSERTRERETGSERTRASETTWVNCINICICIYIYVCTYIYKCTYSYIYVNVYRYITDVHACI